MTAETAPPARPRWIDRVALAILAALAITSGGGIGVWTAGEMAARR